MQLTHLTNDKLLFETDNLVRQERELLTSVLHHLREIELRRLFSSLGFSSLFAYAVGRLGYSEDQAYRRISAMRMLKELPELEEKISAGKLTLTGIGLVKAAFERRTFTREEKVAVLTELEHKPSRAVEKILAGHAPVQVKPDKIRAVSGDAIEMRFSADSALREQIEQLKGLLAHKHPKLSLGELMKMLCELGLDHWSKAKSPAAPRDTVRKPSLASERREVWRRADHKCESCGSRYALEIDHKIPKAKGGLNSKENFRLLCRSCNQRAAIEAYGIEKMESFLVRRA